MSGPAVSTRPARSCKAAADILSERDPVLRRLVAQAGPVRVNPPTVAWYCWRAAELYGGAAESALTS